MNDFMQILTPVAELLKQKTLIMVIVTTKLGESLARWHSS